MESLKGKAVLVTGATSGIGKKTALEFAKMGAKVAISGRREKEGAEVVKQIESVGASGLFVKCDVAVEADVKQVVDRVQKAFGGLNYCFANAGVWGDPKPIVDEQQANIDQIIDINVKGMLYTLKHVAPHIAATGGGAVVTNASILGVRPMPGFGVYNASKFAVVGITRTLALELAGKGVRVNCVSPGPIETDMLHSASGGDPTQFAGIIPMKRIGQPKEIADVVLWLCSDKSSFVNGQIISIDGGYTAG